MGVRRTSPRDSSGKLETETDGQPQIRNQVETRVRKTHQGAQPSEPQDPSRSTRLFAVSSSSRDEVVASRRRDLISRSSSGGNSFEDEGGDDGDLRKRTSSDQFRTSGRESERRSLNSPQTEGIRSPSCALQAPFHQQQVRCSRSSSCPLPRRRAPSYRPSNVSS